MLLVCVQNVYFVERVDGTSKNQGLGLDVNDGKLLKLLAKHKVKYRMNRDMFTWGGKLKIKKTILERIFYSKKPVMLTKSQINDLKLFLSKNNFKKNQMKNIFCREILF